MKRDIRKTTVKGILSLWIVQLLSGRLIFGNFIFIFNVVALLISWHFNHHIGWALFHYVFGFWYLIYCLATYRFADGGFMDIINTFI